MSMVTIDNQSGLITLDNGRITYAMSITHGSYLMHRYFGRHVRGLSGRELPHFFGWSLEAVPDPKESSFNLDTLPREYADMNGGDFRAPAYVLESPDGRRVTRFRYAGASVVPGKPGLDGLPATYVEDDAEAETLVVRLVDDVLDAELKLFYTIFRDVDIVARHAELTNRAAGESGTSIYIERIASMCIDMPAGDYDVVTLTGAPQYEKQMCRRPVATDAVVIGSTRGASSPQATPCAILCSPDATEMSGEVWGMDFVYSGDFQISIERSMRDNVRVVVGMNPLTFGWTLEPGGTFVTPETIMTYSDRGINGMSQAFHTIMRTRLCRGYWRDRSRPVLLNSWEAFEFHIDEEACVRLAHEAASLGIELFVLDDGWFLDRNDEGYGLGDWIEDPKKFPHGLGTLAERIRSEGIAFGLWFEPEMIAPKSRLIRQHPEWVVRSPAYEPMLGRSQYVLDLSNPAVCDYLVDAISRVLRETGAAYVKWDMNRHMTDLGSAYLDAAHQRELSHRYILGLYSVLERLGQAFPKVLFEGCSSGGGRFDAGMLYYMPQVWTSDNSDAVSRLSIQYGTSMLFPPVAMGAHVSACPNGSTAHMTPLSLRFAVAASANLGYEFDITSLSAEEKEELRTQVSRYKELREAVQKGSFWRIKNPQEGNEAAWNIVSADGQTVIFFWCRVQVDPLYRSYPVKLAGLDPRATYRLEDDGSEYGGDELMYAGICSYPAHHDLAHEFLVFHRVP